MAAVTDSTQLVPIPSKLHKMVTDEARHRRITVHEMYLCIVRDFMEDVHEWPEEEEDDDE